MPAIVDSLPVCEVPVPVLSIKADGRVGLIHAVVRPKENRVRIDYAVRPGSDAKEMATSLVLEGFAAAMAAIETAERK